MDDEHTGRESMVEAGTPSQAIRHIVKQKFQVKPATGKQVADFISKGGKIQKIVAPKRPKVEAASGEGKTITDATVKEEGSEL